MGNKAHSRERKVRKNAKHVSRRDLARRLEDLERKIRSAGSKQSVQDSHLRGRSRDRAQSRERARSRSTSSSRSRSRSCRRSVPSERSFLRLHHSVDRDLYDSTHAYPPSARQFSVDRVLYGSAIASSSARDRCLDSAAPSGKPESPDPDILVLDAEDGVNDPVATLPPNVLGILGEDPSTPKEASYVLHDAVCSRWLHTLTHGVAKEASEDLLCRHSIPTNCPFLEPPKINPEFEPILSQAYLTRDQCHAKFQTSLSRGLSALGKGINLALDQEKPDIKEDILPHLVDAGRIFTNLFFEISVTRRNLITQTTSKSVKDTAIKTTPGEYLFGSDFGEKIKVAKGLERAAKDLRPSTSFQGYAGERKTNRKPAANTALSKPRSGHLNRLRPVRQGRETQPRGQLRTSRKDSYRKERLQYRKTH